MQKITLLVFACITVLFSSCSVEPPKPKKARVSAIIDGVPVVFNTVNINQRTYPTENGGYTDLRVTASIDNSQDMTVSFVVEENVLGPHASWYFAYFLHQTAFPKMPDFAVDVSENNGSHLTGTFSGRVQADDESAQIVDFENGEFDIFY